MLPLSVSLNKQKQSPYLPLEQAEETDVATHFGDTAPEFAPDL